MTIKDNMDEKNKDVRSFIPSKIVINDLGLKIFKILNIKRNLEEWNIPRRKDYGDWKVNFKEPFIEVFKNLFNKGELEKTFSRDKGEFKEGTYTFKISLDRSTWAKIKMSAHHDLHYLHECIQDVFDFGDEWRFTVEVFDIGDNNTRLLIPENNPKCRIIKYLYLVEEPKLKI